MSEHSEHPAEGTPPSGERTGPQPDERTGPPSPPPAEGDVIGTAPSAGGPYGPYAPVGERPPSRFRRWSANGSVRMGAVAVVGGLVGGLVGGGIVAAFSDDGHDHVQPVRFERGMPPGAPGFRGPRYWMPRDPRNQPYELPAPPAPTPSPKATG
jgi:hypothetical protein